MNEQLTNKILERIDDDQIVPLPRWRFIFLRISFWLLAVISLIFGSLAVGATLFLFIDYHRHGLFAVPRDMTDFLLMTPSIWIIVFVLFIAVARISIKHTKKGYRYSLRTIVSVSIILSLIFGFILNFVGIGKTTNEFFNKILIYNFATHNSRNIWDRPVAGRLAGVILSVQGKNNFSIRDFNGHIWQVRLSTSKNDSFVPEVNSTVRISGLLESSSSVFIAYSIHEWEQ